MQRDYKKRTRTSYKTKKQPGISIWKWALAVLLILAFSVFLYSLKGANPEPKSGMLQKTLKLPNPNEKKIEHKKQTQQTPIKNPEKNIPTFDFYTILPEKEVVVPDSEIKTRTREERVGKAKQTRYIMQAGSFRHYKDADRLKAQLALMGIESKIEKATVGDTQWNRIKIGPFTKMASVNKTRTRLRQNKIDVVVMEIN